MQLEATENRDSHVFDVRRIYCSFYQLPFRSVPVFPFVGRYQTPVPDRTGRSSDVNHEMIDYYSIGNAFVKHTTKMKRKDKFTYFIRCDDQARS